MARIVSIGAALQDVYLVDHDDFGTNSRGFFNDRPRIYFHGLYRKRPSRYRYY